MLSFALALLASSVAIQAAPPPFEINWTQCEKAELATWDNALPIQCANLSVPLDYTNISSSEKITLELARVPAVMQPSKGSILFNFGGPGEPGRSGLASLDTVLRNFTGGAYDLIAFDPRGTVNTLPFICASTDLEALDFLTARAPTANSSDAQLGRSWARAAVDAESCVVYNDLSAPFINTAFTARDLISVVDALGEDGMLRYWGLSYGTTLGATVAAMFPERIDKLILDGVQNPHEYYHALADFQEWTQADKSFSALFSFCVKAGPDVCPLAGLNMTAEQLEDTYWAFLEDLKYHPVDAAGTVIGYSEVKTYVTSLLYNNAQWPAFAEVLRHVFSEPKNASAALAGVQNSSTTQAAAPPTTKPGALLAAIAPAQALFGIHCGDRSVHTQSYDGFLPVYKELTNISRVFGEVVTGREMTCARWTMAPKERYEGDFVAHTHKPILLIANDGDAFTPVISARNVSAGFDGSVVLELTDAYGHTSTSVPSSCALEHVSRYWLTGELPKPNTKCEVEGKPYSGVTWNDIFVGNVTKDV